MKNKINIRLFRYRIEFVDLMGIPIEDYFTYCNRKYSLEFKFFNEYAIFVHKN